ncbi:enoyl-CoA hydratase-related protein [Sandarakinorhabdus limnophila]|jgi:enoyl-CoA hydratase/carnithine racemase|uniref:enoyl-CoA hydratase-related protein n=2 Tax=Sandarakinorhabdus limnophila TaxID=210512 RepID=UPI0026F137AB|nr:enoyl-CoA hydratase-related protein [Sandarakinorhabdus limnophila]
MMAQDGLTVSNEAGVMIITLDRPEKLNAYTDAMGRALARAVRSASEDDTIRAIIITGAGRAFCAGADVSAGAESFDMAGEGAGNFGEERRGKHDSFIHALFESKKPIIAAINGPAVGVGITLTLPCDVRIAAEGARIGFVFARRGLVPEAGSAWFLPRLVGLPQALRWCLSGRVFDAAEALAGGLVSEVVVPDQLLPRARAIAAEFSDGTAPVAIALARAMLWRLGNTAGPVDALAVDAAWNIALGGGPDVKEGVAAFLEKRSPSFPGKASADLPPGVPWWE